MEIMPTETQIDERLPWHKPEVTRISVSLDTRFDTDSGVDFNGQSSLN